MPQAPDTRERSDSTELVLYDPWCGLLPRHPLLSSYFLTLAVEPRVVTDCVPIVHSYMQPPALEVGLRLQGLDRNRREGRLLGAARARLRRRRGRPAAAAAPGLQLWLAMRRAFRAVVVGGRDAAHSGDLPAVSRAVRGITIAPYSGVGQSQSHALLVSCGVNP